jgi:predicted NBD/HSP70 family sugar kinase
VVLERARGGESEPAAAVAATAVALGRGVAGLVNAHDPDVVVLGGLGPELRAAAPEAFGAGFDGGLMAFHRADPPPLPDAAHGDAAALHGAAALALDHVATPGALASRAEEREAAGEAALSPAPGVPR